MATMFTVGIEVQASAAQQAIARMEKEFDRLAGSSRDLGRSTQALEREFDKAAKGVAGMSKATDELSRASGRAGEGLTAMRVALGNLVSSTVIAGVRTLINQFQQLGSNVVSTGAQAEKTAVAFETFLGSAQKAKDVMKQVRDFAATTPFELPEVTAAAKQLLATRTSADQLIPTIQMLGEIAAGADKPLSQLLFVYTQIKNQGRATGEDINQLLNAGLSMDDIARALGRTAKELGQMKGSSKGLQLSFKEVEKVLKGVTSEGGRFNGLMDKLGSTTAVKLSNLNDAFTKIYQSIYDGISPAISGVLDVIVGILDPLGENKTLWAEVNAQALNFKGYLEQNPAIISTISKGIEDGIQVGLKAATDLAKGLLGYLEKNPDAIAKAVTQVDLLIKGLGKAYEIIALSVEGWEKIVALGKILSGGDRITPTSGADRILEAGGTANDTQGFQDEVNRRIKSLPWWQSFNNAKKEEIVREVFEEVIGKVNQRQANVKQATTPPPQPEAQVKAQQQITAEAEKQTKAIESQLPKQRALADLEITRMQQRLDLEKAYGKISQEEILRREAAIRLRRNELALANLSLEKAEQEQRIKNGENVERRDFSTEEQRIREDSQFVQQKLEAELSRMKIEAEEKREQQRQQSERELFDMRANFEARMLDLQLQNAEIVRQRQMEGRNEVERAVISELNKFYGLAADQQRQQQQYESDYQRLVNDRNILQNRQNQLRKEAQKNNDEFDSILQRYPSTIVNGIPTFQEGTVFSVNDNERLDALESRNFSIRDEFEQLNGSIAKLNLQIQQLSQLEAQRLENANEKYQNATKNWQNLFIGRIHEMYESAKAENDRIALQLRVDNAPMGKQPYMKAGLSVEEVYGSVKNKLRDGLAIAVESGNNDLAAMYKQQLELFDRLQESGDIELLETGLIKLEEARAIADREAERTQFQSSLKDMAQAEVNRTKSLQDQLLLMSLQGDEKEKAIARIRAEEVIEQRRRKLMEQMEGAPQDSTYYAYMVKEMETLEAHLATLTDVFYQQGTAQSQLVKQTELFNEQLRMTQAIADGLGNSFANAFGEFVMGTKTAQQAFADMMGSMANVFMQEFQRMVSQKAAAGLFGLLGNLFGLNQQSPLQNPTTDIAAVSGVGQFNFGGGGTSPSFNAANVVGFDDLAPRFVPFAEGGIVSKPTLGLVGEAGREAIIPLDKLDNMKSNVSIVVNVANDGNNTVDRQGGNQLGRELETAVMAVIQKQKRPGGLLASVR